MRIDTARGFDGPFQESGELTQFRHALSLDYARLLLTLRDARDELRRATIDRNDSAARDVLLAFEIVISIGERKDFLEMDCHRMVATLLEMERRLQRLAILCVNTMNAVAGREESRAAFEPAGS